MEQGHDVSQWLARLLTLIKKSLSRNLGPVKRAVELKLKDIKGPRWACLKHAEVHNPALAYAWATVWMLRCAELVAAKFEHVVVNLRKKTVTLKIPLSKMDQTGWGVKRTLGCCRRKTCSWSCAWKLWTEIVSRKPDSQWLFGVSNQDGKATAKMVAAWKAVLCSDVTGHSARRSGAMMYVREFLPRQEVAFLGRWKSNVVLIYAEEALEEMPANHRACPQNVVANACGSVSWKAPKTPRTPRTGGDDGPIPMTPAAHAAMPGSPNKVELEEKPENEHDKLLGEVGRGVFIRQRLFEEEVQEVLVVQEQTRRCVSEGAVKRVASWALMSELNEKVACTEDAATPPLKKNISAEGGSCLMRTVPEAHEVSTGRP